MSYLKSRHAAMEYGEVHSVVALKAGVGDHTPERFADHELGSVLVPVSGGDTLELLCGPHGRAIVACGDTLTLELLCSPQGRAIPA